MTFLFKSPKIPEPKPVPQPKLPEPLPPTEEVTEEEKRKIRRGRERRGTILTGPRGVLTKQPTRRKTLLGE
jgi:hypothetical protein